MVIGKGDKVTLEYTGKLNDGKVFDSCVGKAPLEFILGKTPLIKGFESAVIGMKTGESKNFTVTPQDAYGDINPELVKKLPKEEIKKLIGREPSKGMILQASNGLLIRITDEDKDNVTINFNHPLAGETLNFHIKIIKVVNKKDVKEEKHECDDDCDCKEE